MTPKIIDKKQKKEKILKAAMKVFASKGVANTIMNDIAKEACIGKGTIYEYFKSKDEMIVEAFNYFINQLNSELEKDLQKLTDPIEKLKTMISTLVKFTEKSLTETIEIILDFWAEGIRQKYETKTYILNLKETYNDYRNIIIKILEDGIKENKIKKVNTKNVASIIIAILDGIMLQWFIDKNVINLSSISEDIHRLIFEGIGKTIKSGGIL